MQRTKGAALWIAPVDDVLTFRRSLVAFSLFVPLRLCTEGDSVGGEDVPLLPQLEGMFALIHEHAISHGIGAETISAMPICPQQEATEQQNKCEPDKHPHFVSTCFRAHSDCARPAGLSVCTQTSDGSVQARG